MSVKLIPKKAFYSRNLRMLLCLKRISGGQTYILLGIHLLDKMCESVEIYVNLGEIVTIHGIKLYIDEISETNVLIAFL